ncbi:hypothetical protein WN48_05392 [Eufriesea mexicana]|nr:hypothetical protein WN48_05392 [Eufriesea mexicana]
MAKIVRYKSLSLKIMKFQEKFPNYKEYISWKAKKCASKRKASNMKDFPEEHSKLLRNDINNIVVEVYKEDSKNMNDNVSIAPIPCQKRRVNAKCGKLLEEKKLNEEVEEDKGNSKKISKPRDITTKSKNDEDSKIVTKIISNEATVKRLTEVLQETGEQNDRGIECREAKNQPVSNGTTRSLKKIDDFFLHANEVTSCSNVTLFGKKENISNDYNINHIFKSNKIRNKRDKLQNEKVNNKRKYSREQKMNNSYSSHEQGGTTERRHWKHSKNAKRFKEKESINNTSAIEYENLHPSWVAKKKQQDIMKQGFQGKKIKFDEN